MISTLAMRRTPNRTKPKHWLTVPPPSAHAIFRNHVRRSSMKSPRSSKKSKPKQEPELSPEEKMQAAQADYQKWSKVAADPSLSPAAAAWALGVAKSAQAEIALRQKAAQHNGQTPERNLAITLGLPLPQDQPTSLEPNPLTPTRPETSGSTPSTPPT